MRDEHLTGIRPRLDLATAESAPDERFQNETLRPILKLQHPLLVRLFAAQIHKRKDSFYQGKPKERLAWIDHTVRTDLRFRNLLIGTILGQFTEAEADYYLSREAEIMRRIVALLVQRLQTHAF